MPKADVVHHYARRTRNPYPTMAVMRANLELMEQWKRKREIQEEAARIAEELEAEDADYADLMKTQRRALDVGVQ
jgi:hypothetical protein